MKMSRSIAPPFSNEEPCLTESLAFREGLASFALAHCACTSQL